MTYDPGGHPYLPSPPGAARVRRSYSSWVVAAALLVGACLGAMAVTVTDQDDDSEPGVTSLLAELDEWEYLDEADAGVPLDSFCDVVQDQSDVTDCVLVDDRVYFREGP